MEKKSEQQYTQVFTVILSGKVRSSSWVTLGPLGGGGGGSLCTWDRAQHLVSMRKCWIHEWGKNFSKTHGEAWWRGRIGRCLFDTEHLCSSRFLTWGWQSRGHWVGAREELFHTVVWKLVSLASSQGKWSHGEPGEIFVLEAGGRGSQRGDACPANGWVYPSDLKVLLPSYECVEGAK